MHVVGFRGIPLENLCCCSHDVATWPMLRVRPKLPVLQLCRTAALTCLGQEIKETIVPAVKGRKVRVEVLPANWRFPLQHDMYVTSHYYTSFLESYVITFCMANQSQSLYA